MQYFPFILAGAILLFFITRPIAVLLHELGHAIPAIYFSHKKASIYVGSYGVQSKSFRFNLGLLEIWLTYNPFKWILGACASDKEGLSVNQQIACVVSGWLTSFIAAAISCYLIFAYNLHGALKLVFIFLFGTTILDLFVNFSPGSKSFHSTNGPLVYSDGHHLRSLMAYKKFLRKYHKVLQKYNEQNYTEAAQVLDKMMAEGLSYEETIRLSINTSIHLKNYGGIKELYDSYSAGMEMNSGDYCNMGFAYSQHGLHDEALTYYQQSLTLNPSNSYALNNIGFTYNQTGKYADALAILDKAIAIEPTAYTYSNRGWARIKCGAEADGLADIHYALKLDENNSYAYRNLGIYYFEKNDFAKALKLFTRAKALDSSAYQIDEWIATASKQRDT